MSGNAWYKRYPANAISGFLGLSLEERGAYGTILDLLYDSGWAEGLPDRDRWFAGQLDISPRKWRTLRDALVDKGKIIILEGDLISNPRYLKERENALKISRKRAENGASGGRKSGERRRKSNDLNGDDEAFASDLPLYARASQSPESRKKKEESDSLSHHLETREDENSDHDLASLTDGLCRMGGIRNLEPKAIAQNIDQVREWLKDDIPIDVMERGISAARERTRSKIQSLRYFDGEIRKQRGRKASDDKGIEHPDPTGDIRNPHIRRHVQGR